MGEVADERPRYLVESVDNALQILQLLQAQPELRVSYVASELGIGASTAHRLLTTLVFRGFVTQDRMTKTYRAGPDLIELGVRSTSALGLRVASQPHLELLAGRIGETVNVLIRQGQIVRFIAGSKGNQDERTHVMTGTYLPAYATSGGKILLADMSNAELRGLFPDGLRKLTPRTKTFTQLVEELSLATLNGYALSQGESQLGLSAIAVPLNDEFGRTIAAVAISALSERVPRGRLRNLVIELRECAGGIRRDLYRRAP